MHMDSPHGDMGHGDHGDMADMHMAGMRMGTGPVRGLPMAREGDDRVGLRLGRLHVPLGPVLPDWPAGLVMRLTLQGDARGAAVLDRDLGAFHGQVGAGIAALQLSHVCPGGRCGCPGVHHPGTAVWCDSTFGEPHASTMMKTS
jgi:hypothetical protein